MKSNPVAAEPCGRVDDQSTRDTAGRLASALIALEKCVFAMEMQEKRESAEFHIHQSVAKQIWDEALCAARDVVRPVAVEQMTEMQRRATDTFVGALKTMFPGGRI